MDAVYGNSTVKSCTLAKVAFVVTLEIFPFKAHCWDENSGDFAAPGTPAGAE